MIVQFDPTVNSLYFKSGNFKKEEIKIEAFKFYRFNVTKADGSEFSVYIFDLQWEDSA